MKKIIGLTIFCIALFSACETDLESPYDNTKNEISFDTDMPWGNYEYSDLSDEIQVTFLVDAQTTSVEMSVVKNDSTETIIIAPQTITANESKCVATYKASEIGLNEEGDEVVVKVTNNKNISKKIFVTYVSCWEILYANDPSEAGNSTITPGVTFTTIETKSTTDTISFGAQVHPWTSTSNANWTMTYQIGKSGIAQSVTPLLSDDKTTAKFIKSMKDIGVAGDTVIVKASITNNGITRTGVHEFIIKNISQALTSATDVNDGFNPAISNTQKDTIYLSATSIKGYRSWLNLKGVTWNVSYTVGSSSTQYAISPITTTNNDTMSIVSFCDVMGQLPGVAQYDTVKVKGTMDVDGASYPVNYSFKVGK